MGQPFIRVRRQDRSETRQEYAKFWGDMYPVVVRAVEQSFVQADMRHPTAMEVRARTEMAKTIVDDLRSNLGWSKQRIRDQLLLILHARLSGDHKTADRAIKRKSW